MYKISCLLLVLMSVSAQAAEVRVAVAANFLSTLKIIQPVYEQQSGNRLLISSASTGKLFAQIKHGAPYDVLLSADQHYSQQLETDDLVVQGSRFVYAQGQLVLWALDKMQTIDETSLQQGAGRIALANPRIAPYGIAAQQVMQRLGVFERLKGKLVQGESVGQAFQFTATGNVSYGFVALSQVLSSFNQYNRNSYWQIPENLYSPLYQDAALLKRAQTNGAARGFLAYLKTPQARDVMYANGYL